MTHPNASSGQPYSPPDHVPVRQLDGGDGGGSSVLHEFKTAATSSPRWLQIIRDVLISLVALIFIIGAVLFGVALVQTGNAIDEIGNLDTSTSAPAGSENVPPVCFVDPDDPTCPPGFDPNGGG